MLSPSGARAVAAALAPSQAVTQGFVALHKRALGPSSGPAAAPVADLSGAMRAGARRGLHLGEAAAMLVCGASFSAHLLMPTWAAARAPVPDGLRYALRQTAGSSLHTLGLHALDLAATLNHRQLQLAALTGLVLLALTTERTRLAAALLWAVVPGVGALMGAAVGASVWLVYGPDTPRGLAAPAPV